MTKRQLMNALLDADEKQDKLYASRHRLSVREDKLKKIKSDYTKQLASILQKENIKAGLDEDDHGPIIFKQHIFEVSYTYMCGNRRYDCDVTKVNSVS